ECCRPRQQQRFYSKNTGTLPDLARTQSRCARDGRTPLNRYSFPKGEGTFSGTVSGSPNSDPRRVRSPLRAGERIKVGSLPTATYGSGHRVDQWLREKYQLTPSALPALTCAHECSSSENADLDKHRPVQPWQGHDRFGNRNTTPAHLPGPSRHLRPGAGPTPRKRAQRTQRS